MNITPEQLQNHKNSLVFLEAKIDLYQTELTAWQARGEAERNMYSWIADCTIDPGQKRTPLRAYFDAHKAHYKAESELKELAIAELKSQHIIVLALVAEAERMVKEPGQGLITQ